MKHTVLVNTVKRVIKTGKTAGLREKLDIYYLVGSLDSEEYKELIALLPEE